MIRQVFIADAIFSLVSFVVLFLVGAVVRLVLKRRAARRKKNGAGERMRSGSWCKHCARCHARHGEPPTADDPDCVAYGLCPDCHRVLHFEPAQLRPGEGA
jgi:cytochrome c553